jgi:Cof subfamily protein (haloacid dehalogenase superfamily)
MAPRSLTDVDEVHGDLDDRLAAIRLCVIDVDGTLLTSSHQVSPATRRAVAAVLAAGVDVILASSRYPGALRPVLDALRLPSQPFIASQGAILGHFSEHGQLEIVERCPTPIEAAHTMSRTALQLELSVSWYPGAQWLVLRIDEAIALEAEITGSTPTVADLDLQTESPDKVMLISDPEHVESLRAAAAAVPPVLAAQFSKPNYLEITAAGVDKGSTLQRLYRARGLVKSQVLAMGDGPNDLGLFSVAGLSVAPANARHEVLAASDFRTVSNDHDGVACVLDRLATLAR